MCWSRTTRIAEVGDSRGPAAEGAIAVPDQEGDGNGPDVRPLAHAVEELLLDDLPALDGVEADLFHLRAFTGPGAALRRHVEGVDHSEAVAVGKGAFRAASVHLVVGEPPLVLLLQRGHALH